MAILPSGEAFERTKGKNRKKKEEPWLANSKKIRERKPGFRTATFPMVSFRRSQFFHSSGPSL